MKSSMKAQSVCGQKRDAIMGSYTASGGVSERPTAGDYSLVYSLGGEPGNQQVAVQSFTPVMDTSPYEQ